VTEFERTNRGTRWSTVLAVIALVSIGVPLVRMLYRKMERVVKEKEEEKEIEEIEDPQKIQALYDFQGQTQDDLQFRKGDYIQILEKPYRNWWIGEVLTGPNKGMRGLLPANYLQTRQTVQIEEIENEESSGASSPQQESTTTSHSRQNNQTRRTDRRYPPSTQNSRFGREIGTRNNHICGDGQEVF